MQMTNFAVQICICLVCEIQKFCGLVLQLERQESKKTNVATGKGREQENTQNTATSYIVLATLGTFGVTWIMKHDMYVTLGNPFDYL